MPNVTIYHNPRCSKSRATLALLQDRGIKPEIVAYLDSPLSANEISALLQKLALKPRALLRTGEVEFKARNLENAQLSDEDIIQAMVEAPILMERPIVACGTRAAIGRPPENVLSIIEGID